MEKWDKLGGSSHSSVFWETAILKLAVILTLTLTDLILALIQVHSRLPLMGWKSTLGVTVHVHVFVIIKCIKTL